MEGGGRGGGAAAAEASAAFVGRRGVAELLHRLTNAIATHLSTSTFRCSVGGAGGGGAGGVVVYREMIHVQRRERRGMSHCGGRGGGEGAVAACLSARRLTGGQSSRMLVALALLSPAEPGCFEALGRRTEEELSRLSPQQVADVLWALALARIRLRLRRAPAPPATEETASSADRDQCVGRGGGGGDKEEEALARIFMTLSQQLLGWDESLGDAPEVAPPLAPPSPRTSGVHQ